MLLQQCIFAPVTAVSLYIREMLRAIQFDDQIGFGAKQVRLHASAIVEGDGQLCVQAESSNRLRQRFQAAKEKCFARASRTVGSFGSRGD